MKGAILTVVQNPISNHGLCIMPQKLMSELNGKLIYSLEIRLKQNVINATACALIHFSKFKYMQTGL